METSTPCRRRRSTLLSLVIVTSLAAACSKERDPRQDSVVAAPLGAEGSTAATTNPVLTQPTEDAGLTEAQKVFTQRCVMCHGQSGKGDGVAAANLTPRPRDYTNATWQASVTDAELAKIIVGGGDSVGKSMMMPANPDLKDKPTVVEGLVKIVRGFARK